MTRRLRECDYIYHGVEGISHVCTLTGRACICLEDWKHCMRRENALRYQLKHPAFPAPIGNEDHVARVVDLNPPSKIEPW
jgi:hypothetical protein